MIVVVTGAGADFVVVKLVEVLRGMEMKELQNFVAEEPRAGSYNILTTSDTTWQVERPRAASSSGLLAIGLHAARCPSKERRTTNDFMNAIVSSRFRVRLQLGLLAMVI